MNNIVVKLATGAHLCTVRREAPSSLFTLTYYDARPLGNRTRRVKQVTLAELRARVQTWATGPLRTLALLAVDAAESVDQLGDV